MDDELQALLTITIPIVPNSQTDSDSSIPNAARRVHRKEAGYDFKTEPGSKAAFEIFIL